MLQNPQVQYSPRSIPTRGTIPLPSEGLLTWTYPLTRTLGISKRTSARKHTAHTSWSPWPAKLQTRKIQETHLRIEHRATKSPSATLIDSPGSTPNWNHINLVTMTSKLHSSKVHKPFYRQYKTTKPIRKIHSWGRRPGEILLSSAGQSRKSCRQPKPSKSQHTSQPLVHRSPRKYKTTTQPIGSTKNTQTIRKIRSWKEWPGEILLSSAGQSRKSCCQPKLSKSHHTSQTLIHRSRYYKLFVTQGAFSKHTLYIDSTSYPLGKSASKGED